MKFIVFAGNNNPDVEQVDAGKFVVEAANGFDAVVKVVGVDEASDSDLEQLARYLDDRKQRDAEKVLTWP